MTGRSGDWRGLPTPQDTAGFGRELAARLRGGDVVLLTGELGAGKTTLVQGLGAGLGVRGPITSPTFVIARVHPSLVGGPALVHVDAYRLGDAAELDDLDLDTEVADAVTVVEWGRGLAEALSRSYLEVEIVRQSGAADGSEGGDVPARSDAEDDEDGVGGGPPDPRRVRVSGHGPRWAAAPVP